jgi:hypothetical protein
MCKTRYDLMYTLYYMQQLFMRNDINSIHSLPLCL